MNETFAMDAGAIARHLGGADIDIEVVAETGSTNADLAASARQGAPAGTVLVATHQSAGRGRLTRSWEAYLILGCITLSFTLLSFFTLRGGKNLLPAAGTQTPA